VVAPSASCVGIVRDLYGMAAELAEDPALAREIRILQPRVFGLTEFLVHKLHVEDVGAYFPHRVTYHPTCHSLRLLRAVGGIEVVDLPDAEQCCGFGGTFAVKNADTSMAMLGDKLRAVRDTQAEVCVAAWVIGARNVMRAALLALLESSLRLRKLEANGDYTARLALLEELKGMPWGAVWDQFCHGQDVPIGIQFLDEVKQYEARELSKRV
jgi:hypothetical protein